MSTTLDKEILCMATPELHSYLRLVLFLRDSMPKEAEATRAELQDRADLILGELRRRPGGEEDPYDD